MLGDMQRHTHITDPVPAEPGYVVNTYQRVTDTATLTLAIAEDMVNAMRKDGVPENAVVMLSSAGVTAHWKEILR
jgi:hypothetical protein